MLRFAAIPLTTSSAFIRSAGKSSSPHGDPLDTAGPHCRGLRQFIDHGKIPALETFRRPQYLFDGFLEQRGAGAPEEEHADRFGIDLVEGNVFADPGEPVAIEGTFMSSSS